MGRGLRRTAFRMLAMYRIITLLLGDGGRVTASTNTLTNETSPAAFPEGGLHTPVRRQKNSKAPRIRFACARPTTIGPAPEVWKCTQEMHGNPLASSRTYSRQGSCCREKFAIRLYREPRSLRCAGNTLCSCHNTKSSDGTKVPVTGPRPHSRAAPFVILCLRSHRALHPSPPDSPRTDLNLPRGTKPRSTNSKTPTSSLHAPEAR